MKTVVFAKWEDESAWELLATLEDGIEALQAINDDMVKHIDRTETEGCPNRLHIVAAIMLTSTAKPEADGKRKVSMSIKVEEGAAE